MGTTTPTRVTGSQFAGAGQYTNLVPEKWNKELLRHFDNNFVFKQCVNTNYEGEIKGPGDTIHVRKTGTDPTISDYSRNQALTYQDMTSTKITITIDQQKYWNLKIDYLDDNDMDVDILGSYIERAGIGIAKVIDEYIEDIMIAGAHADNKFGTLTTPKAITPATIYKILREFHEKFRKQNVLRGGQNPFLVVAPEFMTVVSLAPELVDKSTAKGDELVRAGDTVMQFGGFDLKVSTNITASATKFQFVAGTKEGTTFGMKLTKMQKLDILDAYFAKAVRALYFYGAQVIYSECVGVLTATVSTTDAT